MAASTTNPTSTLESQLLTLRSQLTLLTQRRDKAQWGRDKALSDLKEKFGLDGIEDAEKEAERLEKEAEGMENAHRELLDGIRKEYEELLALAGSGGGR